MADIKPDRLGQRGVLALIESAYKLVGGANATGALASGVAYHAFHLNAGVQGTIRNCAIAFLLGTMTFTIAYAVLITASIDLDRSLDGPSGYDDLLLTNKTQAALRKSGKNQLLMSMFIALISLILFFLGIVSVASMAIHLPLGSN
jgi:hypothetical protein